MLSWYTVDPVLKDTLCLLMEASELEPFRLVGGTALSLQLGHRMSIDIDLFTDEPYGSIDFNAIDSFLKLNFNYVDASFGLLPGMGRSYLAGPDVESAVKLDIFYTTDGFMQPATVIDNIRMATLEDIMAMKIDVIQRIGRKKDFWDLHELLTRFTFAQMLDLHRQRYEYTHNAALIAANFTDFSKADEDLDPICLKGKYWEFIKEDIATAIVNG